MKTNVLAVLVGCVLSGVVMAEQPTRAQQQRGSAVLVNGVQLSPQQLQALAYYYGIQMPPGRYTYNEASGALSNESGQLIAQLPSQQQMMQYYQQQMQQQALMQQAMQQQALMQQQAQMQQQVQMQQQAMQQQGDSWNNGYSSYTQDSSGGWNYQTQSGDMYATGDGQGNFGYSSDSGSVLCYEGQCSLY